ncbi:MAG: radical SAM protein [Candidatus Methanomethylicus sp.]|nr:radical SAM protein [Candidatus Methanomethylicus sp.]
MVAVANGNLRLNKALLDSPYSGLSSMVQTTSNWYAPSYVQIEPTTRCNNRCVFCIRAPNENFDISMDLYKSILDQLHCSRFGTKHVDLTGLGEPLLNPNIVTMIRMIKEKGMRAGFTTNFGPMNKTIARGLLEVGVDYLYVSVDGAKKETFERMRIGSNFERTMSAIRTVVELKRELGLKKPHLKMSAVLGSHNMGEILDMIRLAEDLGMDSISFNRPSGKGYEKAPLPPISFWENLPKTKIQVSRMAITLKHPQPCVALKGCYITYDGWVLSCNSLFQIMPRSKLVPYILGDLKKQSLREIWQSPNYRKIRTLLSLDMRPNYCSYCPRPYQI